MLNEINYQAQPAGLLAGLVGDWATQRAGDFPTPLS